MPVLPSLQNFEIYFCVDIYLLLKVETMHVLLMYIIKLVTNEVWIYKDIFGEPHARLKQLLRLSEFLKLLE